MVTEFLPRITHAERLKTGVIITFEDGKCALYSAALLHSVLSQAEELMDSDEDAFTVD